MSRKLTISQIRAIHEEKAPSNFFDRSSLKFFGQSLASFDVDRKEDGTYTISAPIVIDGKVLAARTVRSFDPVTGKLGRV